VEVRLEDGPLLPKHVLAHALMHAKARRGEEAAAVGTGHAAHLFQLRLYFLLVSLGFRMSLFRRCGAEIQGLLMYLRLWPRLGLGLAGRLPLAAIVRLQLCIECCLVGVLVGMQASIVRLSHRHRGRDRDRGSSGRGGSGLHPRR
jgi:hypothetical protein